MSNVQGILTVVFWKYLYSVVVYSLNPTDWWLSEKLDGVRAYWDGR